MPQTWTVAANLSAVQFLRDDPVVAVGEALATTGFDPRRLELEITESVMLGDEQNVHGIVDGLQALGVRVALDDFGTGYSSLSYLRRFGFNKMKIDQSFVRAATEDREGLALITAIVGLGHTLGLEITAEGIETLEQCDALRNADCTNGQGYFFARPAPLSDLLSNPMVRRTKETQVLAA
jgi:EAL domain-containing protein (putative c-di-GMP-specific phosphodiesterase class I)